MIYNAEVMFGSYRIHASSISLDRAVELVKRGVEFHCKQHILNFDQWDPRLIESDEYELEKCYRDHAVIVDGSREDELKALTRRIDDLWEGSCNHPCDRNNLQKADRDELTRFVVSLRRTLKLGRDISLDHASVLSIDSLAHSLYLRGIRA